MYTTSGRSHVHTKNHAVTHPSLHVRDAHDAHVVLEAVRLSILPLLKRRLLASERDELQSGHVYVWEEAQDDGGLLRWTDGRRWSQSRMRGDYLFYEEKIETTQEERDAKAARRARRASDPNALVPPPIRRKDRPSKPNGLTKQTYSVTVNVPSTNETKKWHLVAYFAAEDYSRLPVVESYSYLRNIVVPGGIYFSHKILCTRPTDRFASCSDESEQQDERTMRHHIYVSSAPPSTYTVSAPPSPTTPAYSPPRDPLRMLPPLSSLGSRHRASRSYTLSSSYTPLSSEDVRVLKMLKVNL